MKRRIWMSLLVLIMAIASIGAMAACKKGEGPETGIYFYDGEGSEYLISLNSGDQFSFMVREANKSGTYSLKGDTLTLKFNLKEDGKLDATISEDRNVIVLNYQNAEMRFLRRTTCTVSFESNGGSEVKSMTVVNGKTMTRPADPVKDNYIFVGWFTDPEFRTPFVFGSSVVVGDMTLYARWGERVIGQSDFNVSFDLHYEDAPAIDDMRTVGGHLYNRPQPQREGFAFRGWWVSMYDDPNKPSYAITDDTLIKEDVVAVALWEQASATKLAMPEVYMTDAGVSWAIVSGASNYDVEIEGPAGFAKMTGSVPTNNFAVEWPGLPMGDYIVRVTATSGSSDNASQTATCFYKNRALPRVSRFEVVLSSTLIFNPIEGAENYTITVDCGDESHTHTDLDNGSSTYFNFSNCLMQEGGITFVVTAHGQGYMDSVSRTFIYDRSLEKVEGVRVDEETQVLQWNTVPNAASYILDISCSINGHHTHTIDNGNKTSYDLKECGAGAVTVSITPKTKGYNSPEATSFSYTKEKIATPGNFKLVENTISWDPVSGATKYILEVDGVRRETPSATYDLSGMTNWATTSDYTLTVCSVDGAGNYSPQSDGIDMRYLALYSTVTYYRNTFSWRHVLGATRYEVALNDKPLDVEAGRNYVTIGKNQLVPGENTFKIKFFDNGANANGSQEVELKVQGYKITFDVRSGSNLEFESIVVAYGDEVALPTASREGYKLDGWYNAPGGAESNAGRYLDTYYQELGDIILYASWSPERYTITYVYDDGRPDDGTEVTSVYYQRNFVFKLPTSIVGTDGFLGWFSSEQGGPATAYTDQYGVGIKPWDQMQGVKVYAHWAHVFDYTLLSDPSKVGGKIASVRSGPEIDQLSVLTVPAEYNGYPVKQVAGMGFMNQDHITELNFPDSLILIGVDAFEGCTKLEGVNIYSTGTVIEEDIQYKSFDGVVCRRVGDDEWALNYYPSARAGIYRVPDGVTQIGSGVFNGKPLTEIIISADVTLVAQNAFLECEELKKITFESALDSLKKELVIENNAFNNCGMLEQIVFPRQLFQIGEKPDGHNGMVKDCISLERIDVAEGNIHGYSSRDNMILKDMSIVYVIPESKEGSYQIPDYVIGVGPYAFAGMRITELKVPKTLRTIDEGAFMNNHQLKKLVFAGDTVSGGLQLVLGTYAFRYCDNLTDVVFEPGSTVGTIGSYCFDNCTSLKEITLPANVTEIKNNAFNNCTSLSSINFTPGEVGRDRLKLGRAIFNSCKELRVINLPAHVTEIVYGAFDGADSLTAVHVAKGGSFSDRDGVLYGANETELIYYPKTTEKGGNVTILNTVQRIGDSVFKNFIQMTQITIPASVNYIGAEAFFGCKSLNTVIFEPSSEKLTFGMLTDEEKGITGSFAFAGCSALQNFVLPDRIDEIPAYFMYYQGSTPVRMDSFAIPNSVQRIGDYAFYSAMISSVNFSTNLKYIGKYAFMGTSLTELNLSGASQLEEIDDSAFEGCRVSSVTFNRNSTTLRRIGDRAFFGTKLADVRFSEGLESIGMEAFSGTSVIMVEFPASLRMIGDSAFKDCISLQRYTLKGDVSYGKNIFAGCTSLFEVIVSEGVRLIPENMLEGTVVKKISLPSTIRTIGQYAFANSSLETVEFARSIELEEIGVGAFQNCKAITSINLPEGIKKIGGYAFADCTGLTSFTVCASVTNVGDYAFSGCSNLESITFNGTDDSGSLSLGSYVFLNCGRLETIHFPANLRTLNGTIFSGCNMLKNVTFAGAANNMFHDGLLISLDGKELILGLPGAANEEVHVPNTVEYVTNEAFARSRFKRIIFDEGGTNPLYIGSEGNQWTDPCNVFANNDFLEEVVFPSNLNTIGACAFENCVSLKSVNIPENVEYIGEGAFRETTHLENFDFKTTALEAIGEQAFYHAGVEGNGISPIVLPEGLREIESEVFSYSGFTEITLPASVNTINKEAFTYCEKLVRVTVNSGSRLRTIDEGAFVRCSSLEEFKLPQDSGVLNLINDEAFYLCENLKAFELPENTKLRTIGQRAFANTGLESFIVRGSIMAIEPYAFSSCTKLKTLTFEDGRYQLEMGDFSRTDITRFDAATFYMCSALEEVELPARMTNIGTKMFGYCTNLKRVKLPASMKLLPEYTFTNCPNLESVEFAEGTQLEKIAAGVFEAGGPTNFTIPKSVKTIENGAFQRATHVKKFIFENGIGITELQEAMFSGCTALEQVDFGTFRYAEMPRSLFSGCSSLVSFTIPNQITKIPANAFLNCSALKKIDFESGTKVTTIDESAFSGAGEFEIAIPLSVNEIKANAFYDSHVKKVTFAENASITFGVNVFAQCDKLEEIELPKGIYGHSTFRHATGLKKLTLPTSMTEIPEYFIAGCTNLSEIKFSGGSNSNGSLTIDDSVIFSTGKTTLYAYACGKKEESYTIPTEVKKIIRGAFSYTVNLKTLTVPETVTDIDHNAFEYCSVETLTFQSGGTFGNGLFYECDKLKKVTINGKCTQIPDGMFHGCDALDTITWSNITRIGDQAFYDCGIKTIPKIPKSCTYVGIAAFMDTPNLEKVEFEATEAKDNPVQVCLRAFTNSGITSAVLPYNINQSVNQYQTQYLFLNCTKLKTVTMPKGSGFTTLGGQMFTYCSALEKVEGLESSYITTVDASAFQGCTSLKDVKLPNTVNVIEEQAFLGSGITSITIPGNVSRIATKAFKDCVDLANVTFNGSGYGTLYFGDSVFDGCDALRTLTLPNRKFEMSGNGGNLFGPEGGVPFLETVEIPAAVTSIPANFFANCIGLKEVKFSEGTNLQIINRNAFKGTVALETINIPDSVVQIDVGAFEGSGLKTLHLPNIKVSTALSKRAFADCKRLESVTFADNFKCDWLVGELFAGCSALKEVELPEVVNTIREGAFRDCTSLTKFTAKGLTSIYPQALAGCSALQELNLPKCRSFGAASTGWTSEESSCFYGCTSLKKITLANEVRDIKIPAYAFNGLESLETIDTSLRFTDAGNFAFNNCKKLTGVDLSNLSSIGQYAFNGCESLTELKLTSKTLPLIGMYAFANCKSLATVEIGGSVSVIGEHAFENCTSLKKVTLSDGLSSIDQYAFAGCTALDDIAIPASVISIGNGAFRQVKQFKSNGGSYTVEDGVLYNSKKTELIAYFSENQIFNVPDSVEIIAESAFAGSAISSISISSSVVEIGAYAFDGCANLNTVTFTGGSSLKTLGAYMFRGCEKLTSLTLPESINDFGSYAFSGSSIESVTIPNSTNKISKYAFEGSALTSVIIPSNVTIIEEGAFMNSTKLTTASIQASVTSVGNYMFAGCTSLEFDKVTLPMGVTTYSQHMFEGCEKFTEITIPDSILGIGSYCFKDCTNLKKINLHDSFMYIGDVNIRGDGGRSEYVFAGTALTELKVPQTVPNWCFAVSSHMFDGIHASSFDLDVKAGITELGEYMFANVDCGDNFTLNLPEHITAMGDYMFSGTKIKSYKLSSKLIKLGKNAFEKTALESFEVESAGVNNDNADVLNAEYLFSGLTSDHLELKLPEYITAEKLGERMFAGLTAKKFTLKLPNHIKYLPEGAMENCPELEEVTIEGQLEYTTEWPKEDTEHGTPQGGYLGGLFANCVKLTKVTLPNTLTHIGSKTFSGCTSLKSFAISDKITHIGASAFENCTSMDPITLSKNVVYVGMGCFRGWLSSQKITIQGSTEGWYEYWRSGAEGVQYEYSKN